MTQMTDFRNEADDPAPNADDLETLERLASLDGPLRHALSQTLDAAETLARGSRDNPRWTPTDANALRSLVHQVFEDSVNEFFTAEATSTVLPHEFRDRVEPNPLAIALPPPADDLDADFFDTLDSRRSERSFSRQPISIEDLSTLLHHSVGMRTTEAGYGVRDLPLFRFPTIGGLCGLQFDIVVNRVDGLERGRYRYDPVGHGLEVVELGDHRSSLVNSTFETDWIFHAPVVLLCIVDQRRTAWKYKTRSYRFSHVDLGAAVQNLALVSTALGFLTCPVAAFFDATANEAFHLNSPDEYLGLMFAVGHTPRPGQ